MNSKLVCVQTILFLILLGDYSFLDKVVAVSESAGDFAVSLEKSSLRELQTNNAPAEIAAIKFLKPKHKKKRKDKMLKFLKKDPNWIESDSVTEAAKKKKKAKKMKKRVHVPMQKETERSNSSSHSEELITRRKPFDIIVHIKMND